MSYNLMDIPSTSDIAIVLISLTLSAWPLTVIKSEDFGHNLVNKSLLFVRYGEIYKSRYQISLGVCIKFLILLATLRGKFFRLKLFLSVVVMWI